MEEGIEVKEKIKLKKYDHLPVRPTTFAMFRHLKNTKSDDAFVLELIKCYKLQNAAMIYTKIDDGEKNGI